MSLRMVLIIRIKYLGKEEWVYGHKDENKRLEEQNKLKNEYLKKVVGR